MKDSIPQRDSHHDHETIRVGTVRYLNSRPLAWELADSLAASRGSGSSRSLVYDFPSRLADRLWQGQLDVALVPTAEWFHHPEYCMISNACVACRGPVLSVKLLFRSKPSRVQTLALDEGSRTSALLAKILLSNRYGLRPATVPFRIGQHLHEVDADAILMIGDRAMGIHRESIRCEWDLGKVWHARTGLPFVFAVWMGRAERNWSSLAPTFEAARDRGENNLMTIAHEHGPAVGLSPAAAYEYLRHHLHFRLGKNELKGLLRFQLEAYELGLIPQLHPLLVSDRATSAEAAAMETLENRLVS